MVSFSYLKIAIGISLNIIDYQFNDVFPDLLKQPLVGQDHFSKNLLSKQAAAAAAIKGLHTGAVNGSIVHPTDDFDLDFEEVDSKILDDPYAFIDPTLFLVSAMVTTFSNSLSSFFVSNFEMKYF